MDARSVVIGTALVLALASCGGKGTPQPTTTAASQPPSTSADARWRRQVRVFAAALVLQLERVQAATGGGPTAGPIGPHLDVADRSRRSFLSALAALERCPADLRRTVPRPPSSSLEPARTALVNACAALASAARSLRDAPAAPGALDFARGRAQEGVRLVVDALATLARAPAGG